MTIKDITTIGIYDHYVGDSPSHPSSCELSGQLAHWSDELPAQPGLKVAASGQTAA